MLPEDPNDLMTGRRSSNRFLGTREPASSGHCEGSLSSRCDPVVIIADGTAIVIYWLQCLWAIHSGNFYKHKKLKKLYRLGDHRLPLPVLIEAFQAKVQNAACDPGKSCGEVGWMCSSGCRWNPGEMLEENGVR